MGFKFSDPSTPKRGRFHPGTPFGLSIYQYPRIINRIWLFINGIRGFRWCWFHWWYFKRYRKWVLLTSGYRQGLWDLLSSRQTATDYSSIHDGDNVYSDYCVSLQIPCRGGSRIFLGGGVAVINKSSPKDCKVSQADIPCIWVVQCDSSHFQ